MGKTHVRIVESGTGLRATVAVLAIAAVSLLALRAGHAVFSQTPEAAAATADSATPSPTVRAALIRAGQSLQELTKRITTTSTISSTDQNGTADGIAAVPTTATTDGRLSTTDAKNVSQATVSAWSSIWNAVKPLCAAIWRPFAAAWSRLFQAGSGDAAGAGIKIRFSADAATADPNR